MIDALIARWRANLYSETEWELDTQKSPSTGALSGVWLKPCTDAPYGAYLKPTTYHCLFPAAAKEKIAADLAYDVGVSVVPVLLYESRCRFGAVQNECCVSLVTHAETPPWGFLWTGIMQSSPVGAVLRGAAAERVSSLFVFDIWIDNRDRKNGGNVVYGEDRDLPSRSGFVGLDHSASMGVRNSWANDGWEVVALPPFPTELRRALDKSVMLRVAERIENLPELLVSECVQRIPSEYLSDDDRNDIVNGLLSRKSVVKAFVLQNM